MFTKNNFFNIISSFIIAFAVLFSGTYSTHIQVDSADSYAHKQESEAVIEAIDIQIAYVDMATTTNMISFKAKAKQLEFVIIHMFNKS